MEGGAKCEIPIGMRCESDERKMFKPCDRSGRWDMELKANDVKRNWMDSGPNNDGTKNFITLKSPYINMVRNNK